jgi:hypothetical protein
MKLRLCSVLLLVMLSFGTAFAQTTPTSVEVKETPYFIALGFGFGEKNPYVAMEVKVFRFEQTDLKSGTASPKSFRAILTFKDLDFPMKIVKPELDEFRADIMDTKPTKEGSPMIPIGHITFKLEKPDPRHDVAVGKLMIKTEDDETSGQYNVFLNSLKLPDKEGKSDSDTKVKGCK